MHVMGPDDEGEDSLPPRRTNPDAVAAGLSAYRALKGAMVRRAIILIGIVALLTGVRSPMAGFAFGLGGICGIVNALLVMRGNERLAESSAASGFVLSSFLRIAVFAIVPVALALRGPWWAMVVYFAGFFAPLAVYAYGVRRAS
ncbi:MAG: ATP synthase subunit I [Vulcanimicrobiaceae bacterium]